MELHSFALTATTAQDPTHELFLEGTAPDNALRPLASCKANAAFPRDLSRISHHGFTPGFSPYRNTGAFRAHPDRNQHLLHLHIFALAPSVTGRGYRQVIFIFQMQRSPAWFPRLASLVQHSQPEAAAGHFPQPKTGGDSREQCSTAALHKNLGARIPGFASSSPPAMEQESRAGLVWGWQMSSNPPCAP